MLLPLIALAVYRLIPESSPVARGASYAEIRFCINCHGDPDNPQLDKIDRNCSSSNKIFGHPEYNVECTDVMAYFESVRVLRSFEQRIQVNLDNPLVAGEKLARKYHCFQCHGQLGQGGFKNAKSLKGYIPGYFGKDFKMLTNNANPKSVTTPSQLKQGCETCLASSKSRISQKATDSPTCKSNRHYGQECGNLNTLFYNFL